MNILETCSYTQTGLCAHVGDLQKGNLVARWKNKFYQVVELFLKHSFCFFVFLIKQQIFLLFMKCVLSVKISMKINCRK